MGIVVQWYDHEQTILHWKFGGEWDWQDLYDAAHQTTLASQERNIDVIINATYSYPGPQMDSVLDFQKACIYTTGEIVLVGGDTFMRSLFDALCRLHGCECDVLYAHTTAEANKLLTDTRLQASVA